MSPRDIDNDHHRSSFARHRRSHDRAAHERVPRYFALMIVVAGACQLLASLVVAYLLSVPHAGSQLAAGAALSLILTAAVGWLLVFAPLARDLALDHEESAARSRAFEELLHTRENDSRLQHALDIAEDEAAVLRIAEQAFKVMHRGNTSSQLLLADGPDGDIDQTITVGEMPAAARCTIRRPCDCPTVRRGQGVVYEDSMALSACPGLGGQIASNCAAACTPIVVGGRGAGMMRSFGETGDPGLFRLLQSLTTSANQIGARLTVMRSMAASEMKATTDPLTGLCNRRAMDDRLESILRDHSEFALVMADIDHFKKVNDTHGHEVGDRVLKVLAATLQRCVRRDDLVCRFGGEEFVLVFPHFGVDQALVLMERVRVELQQTAVRAAVPLFTISAGVVDQRHGTDTVNLLRAADELLYRAKHEGRDRVIAAE